MDKSSFSSFFFFLAGAVLPDRISDCGIKPLNDLPLYDHKLAKNLTLMSNSQSWEPFGGEEKLLLLLVFISV